MAKKTSAAESYGPYYETYIKFDRAGVEWEQEVPTYREVSTSYGIFGVPKGMKMTFKADKDGVMVPVHKETTAKIRKPKKVEAAKSTTDTEE